MPPRRKSTRATATQPDPTPAQAEPHANPAPEKVGAKELKPLSSKTLLTLLYKEHCLDTPVQVDVETYDNPDFPHVLNVQPQPMATVQQCLARGALGDGELFAALFRDRLLCQETRRAYKWFLWNGLHWVSSGSLSLVKLLTDFVQAEYSALVGDLEAAVERDQLQGEALRFNESLRRVLIERAIAICQNPYRMLDTAGPLLNQPEIPWNEAIELLPCSNGTVDMRTGELRAPRPADYFTFVCPTEWKGLQTPAPVFEAALLQSLNDDQPALECLQRVLGYAVSGCNREDLIVILRGALGRNGKGLLMAVLKAALGQTFAKELSPDVVLSKAPTGAGAATPHLASLEGIRLGYVDEANPEHSGHRFNASQIKRLTGARDKVLTRALFEAERAFQALYTLFCLLNDLPEVDANDTAFWERVVMFNFPLQYVDEPKKENQRKRNPDLGKAIAEEHSGVLAWLVRGFQTYVQLDGIKPPASVQKQRDAYQAREDTFQQWLESECDIGEEFEAKLEDLMSSHDRWNKCTTPQRHFTPLLRQERTINGKLVCFQNVKNSAGYKVWRGLAPKQKQERRLGYPESQ